MCNVTGERSEILNRSSIRFYVVRHRFTSMYREIALLFYLGIRLGRQWLLQIYHGEYKYKIRMYDERKEELLKY